MDIWTIDTYQAYSRIPLSNSAITNHRHAARRLEQIMLRMGVLNYHKWQTTHRDDFTFPYLPWLSSD